MAGTGGDAEAGPVIEFLFAYSAKTAATRRYRVTVLTRPNSDF
jgi:hypothetical protein